MRWVALMPLRANSKSTARNNTRCIAGRPLFTWGLNQAIASKCFDEIYVATDSSEIRQDVFDEFPSTVTVLGRSAAILTDVNIENALLEFQRSTPFDVVCLIQATFPLTRAEDFSAAKYKFLSENLDSLVTVAQSKRLAWTMEGVPVNRDPTTHPKRQCFEGYFIENGAFYLTSAKLLEDYGCCIGGHTGIHQMNAETAVEIVDETNWIIAEQFLLRQKLMLAKASASRIKALVLDVDGTLTDGGMYYGPAGEALKKFHTRDAHGLQLLRENDIRVGVMSTENSPSVEARMRKLHIDEYHPGVQDKFPLLLVLAKRWGLALENIAYIGDDVNDLECLSRVGFAFCPADSVPEILRQAHIVCKHLGGNGAVREVCDFILKVNDTTTDSLPLMYT
jgi:YrbI family 3-deoxy-D-manno-octulosonate 8-phosphate phosphatase